LEKMPRYKYYSYKQTAMIAIDLVRRILWKKQIIPGSLEYAIHKLVPARYVQLNEAGGEERVKIDAFE